MSAKIEPMLTIEDLDAMPEDGCRYELIEGELFVSRAPSLKHQLILGNLHYLFRTYLERTPIGTILANPGVIFSEFSGVIPDLVFISNERWKEIAQGDRIKGAPELVIEILSPGAENERRDRQVKRQLYRKFGVKEYWVIDPEQSSVEIYRGKKLSHTATMIVDDALSSPLLPGFRCPVRELFVMPKKD